MQIFIFAKICFEANLELLIPYMALFAAFIAGFHKEREEAFIVSLFIGSLVMQL